MSDPLVTIIVVNWNGLAHTRGCLASLRRLTYPAVETIVVDNGSTDGSVEALRAEFPEVHLIANPANVGFGPAAMVGARKAKGDYLVVLNNDLEVDPDWLDRLVATSRAGDYAAVASLILFLDRPTHVNGAGGDMSFLGYGWPRHYGRPREEVPLEPHEVAFCAGGVTLYARRAFEEVGGYDEDFFLYVEDSDLCWRLRLAGYRIAVDPSAILRHEWDFHRNKRKLYLIERNRLLMLAKNWSAGALVLLAPAILFFELAVCAGAVLQGWGGLKLAAYRDAWKALPAARQKRPLVVRRVHEADAAGAFRGGIHHAEMRNPVVRFVLNPILAAYWALALPLLRLVGAKPGT